VGLSAQAMHSISILNKYLELSNTSLQIKFPTQLPSWTYFNFMSFEFLVEWQVPTNFNDSYSKALAEAKTDSARQTVKENFRIYQPLNNHDSLSSWFQPTAVIFTYSASGDTRDDLFNPTKGYFTNITLDSWLGPWLAFGSIAKYSRFQFIYELFTPINKSTVFALKARAGYIYWDTSNSYVPLERQFFAGGANSNRGWESRMLRYLTQRIINESSVSNLYFAKNFIGSRVILEGTFELRWKLGKPRWASDLIGNIINMGILTGFIDWGNTFHWLAFGDDKYYNNFTFFDYIKGISVSAGLGIGVQTPVGPFRLDFALPFYDPTPIGNLSKFVPNRDHPLRYWQYHIGLGYAF
jgi:outer membrane protein assembly factor BamA